MPARPRHEVPNRDVARTVIALLEHLLARTKPPVYLTQMTRDRMVASDWLSRFEGAGLDGVIAKPEGGRTRRASAP